MLSCARQVARDMESRCYPGQSLIWTSASEKTHMTHGVCARKQFAWNQWNERQKHCVNLYFCTNTWLLELKTQAGEGLTNGLPKQKWGENGRPWTLRQIDITSPMMEQMSAIPCFEAHMQTVYPHTYIEIYKTIFLANLFHVCYCHFWSPTPPPLKISCTVLRVVTGETTRGIPKTYPKAKLWDQGIVVSNDYPLLSHKKLPNYKVLVLWLEET